MAAVVFLLARDLLSQPQNCPHVSFLLFARPVQLSDNDFLIIAQLNWAREQKKGHMWTILWLTE